jgi:uncharacterized protein
MLVLTDRPKIFDGLHTDNIDDFVIYYNPKGYGGMTLVDDESQAILDVCHGSRTIDEISLLDGRSLQTVLDEIQQLFDKQVVEVFRGGKLLVCDPTPSKARLTCWMHLTNSCNLACSYCYIHKSSGVMTVETGKTVIDKMTESCQKNGISAMNLKFAGGEPLLRFDLLNKLVRYAQKECSQREVEVTFTVLTNATLVTPEIADYLRANEIGVGVSLDGIGTVNDANRKFRNRKGSFNSVLTGLEVMKSAGFTPSIMTTVSLGNYRSLPNLTDFLIEGGYQFNFSLERNWETGHPGLLDNLHDLTRSLHECYDRVEARLPSDDFLKLHTIGQVNFYRPAKRSCGAGNSFFSVGHDGRLGLCGQGLSSPFSSIYESGDLLSNVRAHNTELVQSVVSDYQTCCDCVWRNSCAGGCPLQTKSTFGRYDTRSPYCEVYREVLPRMLRIKALQMIRSIQVHNPEASPATSYHQGGE